MRYQPKPELASVNTTDGLFADFAGFVARFPELRLWQALQAWSGYNCIMGGMDNGHTEDTYHKTTKGPKRA